MTEFVRGMWKEIIGAFVGVIVGSLPIAISVLAWGVSVETRLTRHDSQIESATKMEEAAIARAVTIEANVTKRLDRIEDKLDRAIGAAQERQHISPGLLRAPSSR